MKLQKQYYNPESNGFYGAFYACPSYSDKGVILMLGDAVDDLMAVSGVKWLHRQGCHVMAMSPGKKDYGHHNYPLERFGKAIEIRAKTSFAGRRENQSREYSWKSSLHRGGG